MINYKILVLILILFIFNSCIESPYSKYKYCITVGSNYHSHINPVQHFADSINLNTTGMFVFWKDGQKYFISNNHSVEILTNTAYTGE